MGDLERLRATYERKVGRCNARLTLLQRREDIAADDEARLAAALAQTPPPAQTSPSTSASGWAWPASGPLTSGFGQRWGRLHAGIDIGAPTAAPIYTANGGVVA